jgi:hypothetical protein
MKRQALDALPSPIIRRVSRSEDDQLLRFLATNTMGAEGWFYLDMDSPFSPKRYYGVKLVP